MDVLKPLLGSTFRSEQAIEALSRVFLGYAGKPLDLLYSRIGGLNGRFFPRGWGNLGIVNLKEDIDMIKQWPPQGMKIDWKLLQQGLWDGTPFKLYEGTYRTPCINRIYDALPPESRIGRVQLLVPSGGLGATHLSAGDTPLFSQPHTSAAVLHLAATGDHGFSRRLKLGGPLLAQGVCQLVHESPFYGARRPPEQKGSKLCAVSDLLVLGWATIYESLCLLNWLEDEGIQHRGICGLSMGGVHAAMTAGLYPRPLAIAPLLTPRSAAVAYCDGALAPLMAWRALLTERDLADNEVEQVVAAAAQPVSLLHRARYVQLQQVEDELQLVESSIETRQQHHRLNQQPYTSQQLVQQRHDIEAVAMVQQAAALAAATEAAVAEQVIADNQQHQVQQSQAPRQQDVSWQGSAGNAGEGLHLAMQAIARHASNAASHVQTSKVAVDPQQFVDRLHSTGLNDDDNTGLNATFVAAMDARQQGQAQPQHIMAGHNHNSWKRQTWRHQKPASASSAAISAAADAPSGVTTVDTDTPPPDTFRRLRHVLETYTDVTRYPRPVRPDAAVLVAAKHDGYVDLASVQALQDHWPGSELRLVSGGHVSAFLMHQDSFRSALKDSLARLANPS